MASAHAWLMSGTQIAKLSTHSTVKMILVRVLAIAGSPIAKRSVVEANSAVTFTAANVGSTGDPAVRPAVPRPHRPGMRNGKGGNVMCGNGSAGPGGNRLRPPTPTNMRSTGSPRNIKL